MGRFFNVLPRFRIDALDCCHDPVEAVDGRGFCGREEKAIERRVKAGFHILHDVINTERMRCAGK